eukprot:4735862-Ditylum_brightwellii.AAC.1
MFSESPDYFVSVTSKLKSNKVCWKESNFLQLGYHLSMQVWKERCSAKTVPGQCHTPAATKEAPTHRVHDSLMLMAAMHHTCHSLTDIEKQDQWFFNKALAIFADSKNDVYYAGTLLTQHILVVGSAVGIYPIHFTTFIEIANIAVKKNLNKQFSFFDGSTDPTTESSYILKALPLYFQDH